MDQNQPFQRGTISLVQLIVSDEFQIRRKLNQPTITRYEHILRSGGELPPVKVAKVQDRFILVDGFHRLAARERLGQAAVEAEVVEATYNEAHWLAASGNLEHGLPLKTSEIRDVFRAYIKARRHLKGRGKLKTYREIGAEIGRPHTTIRNWMRKDYPEIFKRYSGDESFTGDGGLVEMESTVSPATEAGLAKVVEFRDIYRATVSAEARWELAQAFAKTARELLGDGWVEEYKEDF